MRSPSPSMRPRSASGCQHSQRGRSNSRYIPSPPSTPEDARSCSNYLPHIRRTPWTRRSVSTSPPASPNTSSHWSLSVEPPSSPRIDSPAPVIPPVIPRNGYDAPTPYVPARPPPNVGYIQPPAWAYYLPGEYPGVPRAHVNAYVSATSGPDAELPAHTDARYQVTGPTYPTSLAQQRSPWLFPNHCAPAHGCHHHQPGSTNVNVSTNGDVGVVRVTVQTQPR
ncbi:hypothetical protein BD779DRAFT_1583334 [Infundibulicybe gibba]|nr:hypothetical protein BD779DRAFT_1583334 [Infundibulicybe gibba]